MKLLIDECLSPQLAVRAQAAGYGESSHVVWMGKQGWKDHQLKPVILDGDWTFVTRNSIDFRGSRANPGNTGQYADVEIHAGLICFNGPDYIDRQTQFEMLEAALNFIRDRGGDIINQVVEVPLAEEQLIVEIYRLPA